MKSFRNIYSSLILVLFMLIFCSANAQPINQISVENATHIGDLHNEYLSLCLNESDKTVAQLTENALSIEIKGLNKAHKEEIISFLKETSLSEQEALIWSQLKTPLAKRLYNEVRATIKEAYDFKTASQSLDQILKQAVALIGQDRELLYIFIEVSRKSLEFWMPVKNGGLGNLQTFQENAQVDQKINWSEIAISDGVGAMGVLIRTFYLAAGGPLTWAAILGAIGWGAAWGSGSALLNQLIN